MKSNNRCGSGAFELAVKYFTEIGPARGAGVIRVARGGVYGGAGLDTRDRLACVQRSAWLAAAYRTAHGIEASEIGVGNVRHVRHTH